MVVATLFSSDPFFGWYLSFLNRMSLTFSVSFSTTLGVVLSSKVGFRLPAGFEHGPFERLVELLDLDSGTAGYIQVGG